MSQSDINKIPDDEFRAINPFLKRSCSDCGHIIQLMSLWCNSIEAHKVRGTRIPGCIKCPYWKPDLKEILTIPKNVSKVICPDGKTYLL